jgi:hypothetical protein
MRAGPARSEFACHNCDDVAPATTRHPKQGIAMQLMTIEEPPSPPVRPRTTVVEVVILVGAVATAIFAIGLVMNLFKGGTEHESPLLDDPAEHAAIIAAAENGEYSLGSFEFTMSGRISVAQEAADDRVQVVEFDAVAVIDRTPGRWRWLRRYNERIREAIAAATRSTSAEDLNEADVHSLRERMRSHLNSLLGEGVIREVLFSHFRNFALAKL